MAVAFDRRLLLLSLAALALPAVAPGADSARALLARAMARMGGEARLRRVRRLRWQGEAVVHAAGGDIRLGAETEVVPFVRARSATWLLDRGRDSTRVMTITADGGSVERDGRTEPLPAALVAHERAQFAVYGLMLLAPLAGGRAALSRLADEDGLARLQVSHPAAPVTILGFTADGRLAAARNAVPDPVSGIPVPQLFTFSAEAMPRSVRWPRRLAIAQGGTPYFELELDRFSAETE